MPRRAARRHSGERQVTATDRPTILVTGAAGQLGFELAHWLAPCGDIVAVDREEIDLADADAIRRALRAIRPRLIVNAAAYTAVDRAEQEPALAEAINARAPGILAEEAERGGAALIHYSTDYVFDGTGDRPYAEDAPTAPLNVYGATKRAGEQAVLASGAAALVFRTSWVYGLRGSNFLLTMRRLAAERDELRIVADQAGTPNWCRELARATARIVAEGFPALAARRGLYHLSSTGSTTWFDFARAILGEGGRARLLPIATADYPTPARRPRYGVLDTGLFERTFGFSLPPWREALQRCLASPAEPSSTGDSAAGHL
ncbi:MAG: dTDP-4-dehydrorhamnose reductase [Betaproteobacteria bacterium]|nr:dTDP-4-dehydrorhamnose reductase [Betaproteobacteria bacterium]